MKGITERPPDVAALIMRLFSCDVEDHCAGNHESRVITGYSGVFREPFVGTAIKHANDQVHMVIRLYSHTGDRLLSRNHLQVARPCLARRPPAASYPAQRPHL
ncbi:hypothetical protein [Actinomadura sp. 6N118]|uniref:hypothetical protein n=1 Tax=Actinomadura sp. 6N118 TaxID=3375151 RepID=UPI0037B0B42A